MRAASPPGTGSHWAWPTVPGLRTQSRWARVTVPGLGTESHWAMGTVSGLVPLAAIANGEKRELKFELAAWYYGLQLLGAMSPQGYQHWFREYCWAGQLLDQLVAAAQTWVKQH